MGKKGHDLPKFLRQELVLNIVENFSGEEGISTSEIFELLDNKCPGVNKRTLYRDLQELSARFPIYDETNEGKAKWFIQKDHKSSTEGSLFRSYVQKELMIYLNKSEEELIPSA
jgi:Fe2+ or Zn2+ uptake regulation protein